MKQIVLIFFTFSGICNGFAQKPAIVTGSDTMQPAIKPFARLFPNPAMYKVEIELKGFEAGFIQLQFFDIRGNRIRAEKRLLFTGNEIIVVMFALQPGIYFLLLKQNEKRVKKKLLVQ